LKLGRNEGYYKERVERDRGRNVTVWCRKHEAFNKPSVMPFAKASFKEQRTAVYA